MVPLCVATALAGPPSVTRHLSIGRITDFAHGMPSAIGIHCITIPGTSAAR